MLKIAVCVDLSLVGRREGGMVRYCCQPCCRGDGREQGSLGSEDDTVPGAEKPAPPVCLLGRGRRHSTHLWGSGSALGQGSVPGHGCQPPEVPAAGHNHLLHTP